MAAPVIRCFPVPSRPRLSWRQGASFCLLPAALAACTVGPDFSRPVVPDTGISPRNAVPAATPAIATIGGTSQAFASDRDIEGEWWKLFRSPEIAVMVGEALKANPDLAAAQATLREASENERAEQGSLFPTLSASASATRERLSPAETGIAGRGFTESVYSGTLNASYTLDIFGGIRRDIEQLGAQVDYQRYELEATYLNLTANLVNAILTEASLHAQVAATEEIIKIYRESLDVTRQRFDLGGVSRADVLQQEASLASEVATLPPLRKQYEQQRNQVAVYLGLRPGQYTRPTIELASLTLPSELPVSLPSKIVDQRPDIRAYEALLHAATANVGIATANMLPQVTLTGSYGRDALSPSTLFTPGGIVWSLASSLTQPIFQGGTLLHRKRSAEAALNVAAAQYSSIVNTAFQNVANALVALSRDAETLRDQLSSEQTAAESLSVARAQFQAGGLTYLNVLQAEQTFQSARLQLVGAQVARFTDTVSLFQALGGGWWNRQDVDPNVATCCEVLP